MPYFEEWIVNSATSNVTSANDYGVRKDGVGLANVDFVRLMTHRSKKSQKGNLIENHELPSSLADPYTTQLGSQRVKHDAAIARGFSADLFQEDRGHPFELVRYKSEGGLWSGSFSDGTPNFTYSGKFLELEGVRAWTVPLGFAPVSWSNLPAYAQTTYVQVAPTPGRFDLSTAMGELPQGIPRLALHSMSAAKQFKGMGSDYLNVEFGWKPFISDLIATGEALLGATTALLGPRGPLHRMRSEEPSVENSDGRNGRSQIGPVNYILGYNPGDVADDAIRFHQKAGPYTSTPRDLMSGHAVLYADITQSTRTTRERWFEGSFTYIPRIGFNPDSYLQRFEELVSPDITPKDLYALAPWSWLMDWFVDIGGAIAANEAASDNRILSNYAYAMEKVETRRGAIFSNIQNLSSSKSYAGPVGIARQWTTTGKRRIRANPFGFKPMTSVGLNPNQWMILAALGLSKASF